MSVGPVQPNSPSSWMSKVVSGFSDLEARIVRSVSKLWHTICESLSATFRDMRGHQVSAKPRMESDQKIPGVFSEVVRDDVRPLVDNFWTGYDEKCCSYQSYSPGVKDKGLREFIARWFTEKKPTKEQEKAILLDAIARDDNSIPLDVFKEIVAKCSIRPFSDEDTASLLGSFSRSSGILRDYQDPNLIPEEMNIVKEQSGRYEVLKASLMPLKS